MKSILLNFSLFLTITIHSTNIYSESKYNYISESYEISRLMKESYQKEIKFKIVQGNIEFFGKDDSINFEHLYIRIVNNLKEKKQSINKSKPQKKLPATGGRDQPSPNEQESSGETHESNNSEADFSFMLTRNEARKELMWMLYISTEKNIRKIIAEAPDFPKSFKFLDVFINGEEPNGITNVSGIPLDFKFNETAIIYGLTDFMISRSKQQIIELYLNKVYENLNENFIFKSITPQTLFVLDAFNKDNSLNISVYGDKWKAAFQEDLRNIPVRLQDEGLMDEIFTEFNIKDKDKLKPIISGGCEITYNLYLKKNIVSIIQSLSVKYLDIKDNSEFRKAIVFANSLLTAGGYLDEKNKYITVNSAAFQNMDKDSWSIFLKLFFLRQKRSMDYFLGTNGSENLIVKSFEDNKIESFVNTYKGIIELIQNYQNLLDLTTDKSENKLGFNEIRSMFEISFQIIERIQNLSVSLFPDIKNTLSIKNYQDYALLFSEIGEGISAQQYAKVIDGFAGLLSKFNNDNKLDPTIMYLQKYGSFMVNILSAKNADDVSTALDELIPKAQYQIKNTTKFSISASGYVGATIGAERIKTDPIIQNKSKSWGASVSPYLPICLDLNWGKEKVKNSNSIFIQFLDLGSVLNYRLTNNQTESSDPNITFKQLLSPGFGYMHHFKNSPLVWGFGANYSPMLRSISQAGNTYKTGALRISTFLAVDITLLNIFAKK